MRSPTIVLLVVLFVAGCSNNKGKLKDTTWISTTSGNNSALAGKIRLEFGEENTMVYTIGDQPPRKGKYTVGMRNTVVFGFDRPLNGHATHTQKIVLAGNRLTLIDSDGKELTFVPE